MAQLGADAAALVQLGEQMRRAAGSLELICVQLDRRVRVAPWRGRDGERFRQGWSAAHRPQLLRSARELSRLSVELQRQAREQQHASQASPAIGTGGASPRPSTASRPSLLPPAPVSERRFLGDVEAKVGLVSVVLGGTLVLQQLAGGRTRVVHTEGASLGATIGAGASAQLSIGDETFVGAPTSSLQADATARIGPTLRRSWEVHDDEVESLLVRLAAQRAIQQGTGQRNPLGSAGALIDVASRRLTGYDPQLHDQLGEVLAPPRPERVERFTEVSLGGTVGAGLSGAVGAAGQLGTSGSIRAGVAERSADGSRSLVVETDQVSAAVLSSTLLSRLGVRLPGAASTLTDVRIEMPLGSPAGRPMLVHASGGDGPSRTEVRVAVLADSTAVHAALLTSVQALRDGDLHGSLARLASVDLAAARSEVHVGTVEVSGRSVRGGATVAAGAQVGITTRGQVLELTR